MKRLKTLAELLNKSGFHKEASDAVKLSPVEHPDWELWSREEEAELLESTHPKVNIGDGIRDKLMELGITIMGESSSRWGSIGSGSLGMVYSGVYNGKPVAVKIAVGQGGVYSIFNNDVENWNKISEVAKTAPEFVKNILPNIFLAYEGTTKGIYGNDQRTQILVMERLHKIPGIIANTISGKNKGGSRDSNPPDWMIEEHVYDKYPEIWNLATSLNLSFPGERIVAREAVKLMKDGIFYFKNQIIEYFQKFITKIPDDVNRYIELTTLIHIFAKSFNDIGEKIPTTPNKREPGTDWQPMGGLDNFWEGIKWLRNKGISVSDLKAENIMMDDTGNLKLSDLGGLYTD